MSISVELVEFMGSDLTVVNAARVSMDKQTNELRDRDVKLIQWMAQQGHMSPFRHVYFQFRIRAPEFVARQAYKHCVGISATSGEVSNDSGWNEISMRYVRMKEFFHPQQWRKAPPDVRQGSAIDDAFNDAEQKEIATVYENALATCITAYNTLLEKGVAREMARMILPLSVETQWIWTMSLQAAAHFVKLRTAPDAQAEIRELADHIAKLCESVAPVSWAALSKSSHV